MIRLLKLVAGVALTSLVLYWSDPSRILDAAAAADWRWLAAAVGLVFVDRTLMAMRWIDLLVALAPGTRPPLSAVLRVFFVSSFVSNFVPSVGADLYRAYALSRYNVHLAESTASVLMDRALGVLSVVLVAAIALPFATVEGRQELIIILAGVGAVCVVAAAVVFSERAAGTLRTVASGIPIKLLQRVTAALTDAVRSYGQHHGAMVRVLALSVLVQVFRVLQAWCLGHGAGNRSPAGDLLRVHSAHRPDHADPDHPERTGDDAARVRTIPRAAGRAAPHPCSPSRCCSWRSASWAACRAGSSTRSAATRPGLALSPCGSARRCGCR